MKNKLKWIIYVVPIVVIAVLVAILVNLLMPREYERVTIENQGALDGVSDRSVNDFRESLIELLQGQGFVGEDATVDDVVIRGDTVDSFRSSDGSVVTTFIADIDSIRQTYRVRITDTNQDLTDLSVYIACPRMEEMKYPEVECKGHYGSTSAAVDLYLPYAGTLASGEKYLVKSITTASDGERALQIYLYSCDEAVPPTAETEAAVRDWVAKIGDTVDYVYNVRVGYCEGDAI